MRVLVVLCLLATLAHADRGRVTRGYRDGHPAKIRVVYVDGNEVEIETARAYRKMASAARKDGFMLAIRSGFRDHQRQQELYKAYRRGWGHKAARPGFSNHESGRALDLVVDDGRYEWLKRHAARFGFVRTVRGEAWHWEFRPSATARASSTRHRS